jgi:hypothetical protein
MGGWKSPLESMGTLTQALNHVVRQGEEIN